MMGALIKGGCNDTSKSKSWIVAETALSHLEVSLINLAISVVLHHSLSDRGLTHDLCK